jgi:hypothetical protein
MRFIAVVTLLVGALMVFDSAVQAQFPIPARTRPLESVAMPVPSAQDNGMENCTPFIVLQNANAKNFFPCSVQVQTAVPFSGFFIVQRMCAADGIVTIYGVPQLNTTDQPAGSPTPANPVKFPFFYNSNASAYGWDEVEHLSALGYIFQYPGQYSIKGTVHSMCGVPHADWGQDWALNVPVTANEPVAPHAVTPRLTSVSAGQTYPQFGRIDLEGPAPGSGTLLMLSVDNWQTMAVKTDYGTTGLQQPGGDLVYNSTYVFVPAGAQAVNFDLQVSSAANPGDSAVIRATCVGSSGSTGNYPIPNKCTGVNNDHPVQLRVTVGRN